MEGEQGAWSLNWKKIMKPLMTSQSLSVKLSNSLLRIEIDQPITADPRDPERVQEMNK